MLQVNDHPDLLETIKRSNPKLKKIAMSVAERLRQEGRQEGIQIGEEKGKMMGIQIGEEKGKLEGKLEIAKSMREKGYAIEDIMLLTGLSRTQIQGLV